MKKRISTHIDKKLSAYSWGILPNSWFATSVLWDLCKSKEKTLTDADVEPAKIIEKLKEEGAQFNMLKYGIPYLFYAYLNQNIYFPNLLSNSNPMIQDYHGRTLAHYMVNNNDTESLIEISKINPKVFQIKDNNGETALQLAIRNRNLNLVKKIIEINFKSLGDINKKDLHHLENESEGIREYLLQLGVATQGVCIQDSTFIRKDTRHLTSYLKYGADIKSSLIKKLENHSPETLSNSDKIILCISKNTVSNDPNIQTLLPQDMLDRLIETRNKILAKRDVAGEKITKNMPMKRRIFIENLVFSLFYSKTDTTHSDFKQLSLGDLETNTNDLLLFAASTGYCTLADLINLKKVSRYFNNALTNSLERMLGK